MPSIMESFAALTVGSVESVSPSEIIAVLELDAPQATALNTGVPTAFPRVNGYVLIPNEGGAVVGLIVWLGIERSPFPKRTGLRDYGVVDLPYPVRKMCVAPIGTLVRDPSSCADPPDYCLNRGVTVFPSVGDPVLLPTHNQLRAIVEARGRDRRVLIGRAPLAGAARVSVDPDKLFGRHLAVLGNTGSGKSCSVAGLIRWSIEAALEEQADSDRQKPINARFVILDPNGEYPKAFADMGHRVRVFRVPTTEQDEADKPLHVPAWMWNSWEWTVFAGAQPGAQRPLLLEALRDMKAGGVTEAPVHSRLRRLLKSYLAEFQRMMAEGVSAYTGFPSNKECGDSIRTLQTASEAYARRLGSASTDESSKRDDLHESLSALSECARRVADAKHWASKDKDREGYNNFSEPELDDIVEAIKRVLSFLPEQVGHCGPSQDAPIPFEVKDLADHLEFLATRVPGGNVSQFVATLAMRIRTMLGDRRLGPVVHPECELSLADWLKDYIGDDGGSNGQIAILDLSLVPSDVIHTVIAVTARLVFEALQRYHRRKGEELPTVLVLEEAHTFVSRERDTEGPIPTATQMCRQVFERIAREGRKFGLGLVLSSQRPSELSPTVLAQCNTFLLHRLVNDHDQELVRKLVPGSLAGLLRDLPNLPTRQAILLGWATAVPVLVEMRELPKDQRPRSTDPCFWETWTGVVTRSVHWQEIADEWASS